MYVSYAQISGRIFVGFHNVKNLKNIFPKCIVYRTGQEIRETTIIVVDRLKRFCPLL